jgi:hypothetical protein
MNVSLIQFHGIDFTLNWGMLISNECVVNFPVLSATFTVMATNDALRFLQLSELTATPNFHCISTS